MANIDDLKATYEQAIASINKRSLDTFLALHHDQVVQFGPFSPFADDGKAAFQQGAQALFAYEHLAVTPLNPQYHVVGNTGGYLGTPCNCVKAERRTAPNNFCTPKHHFCEIRWEVACYGRTPFTYPVGKLGCQKCEL